MSDLSEINLEKALTFFERAEDVASTDNFDYAIEMYIEGLRLSPDALEDGHGPLRRMALIRQAKGGKKPSIKEKMKYHGGKSPLDEMLNAEFLMAKDPDNLGYAEAMLKAAVAGQYYRTADWIADLVFDANKASNKPSFATYMLLKDSYKELQKFSKAVAACQKAAEMKPEDGPLQTEFRDLSAQLTMQKGKYDGQGDFRKSIKDKEVQEQLHAQENLIKSVDFRKRDVEEAKRLVKKLPSQGNIIKLADALLALETDKGYQEALKLLGNAYKKYQDFAFKKREGELRLKKLRDGARKIKSILEKTPKNEQLKEKLLAVEQRIETVGLEHYKQCVENYPTDLKMKYEYGNRLMHIQKYDEAIPLFQEAKRDPRYKVTAIGKIGMCFLNKGWYPDAIDLFQQALDACEVEDNSIAKELRYNLGKSYEHNGQTEEALEIYRKLAQLDFGYRDIRDRIDSLRNSANN